MRPIWHPYRKIVLEFVVINLYFGNLGSGKRVQHETQALHFNPAVLRLGLVQSQPVFGASSARCDLDSYTEMLLVLLFLNFFDFLHCEIGNEDHRGFLPSPVFRS